MNNQPHYINCDCERCRTSNRRLNKIAVLILLVYAALVLVYIGGRIILH